MAVFRIKDILGCKAAEVEAGPGQTTVVCGHNSAGKTSMLYAMAAVASQNDNPLGLAKSKAKLYCNETAAGDSKVEMEIDGHEVGWTPEHGLEGISSSPPISDPVSAGLKDPLDFTAKDWRGLFDQQVPDKALFVKALATDLGREESDEEFQKLAGKIYAKVLDVGVEATVADEKTRIRNLKREWQEAVARCGESEAYGIVKASNWYPPGFDPEALEAASQESLYEAVREARQRRDVAMRSVGYDEAQRDHLEAKAARIDEAEKEAAEIEAKNQALIDKMAKGEEALKKVYEERDKARAAVQEGLDLAIDIEAPVFQGGCPTCGGDIVFANRPGGKPDFFGGSEYEAEKAKAAKVKDEVDKVVGEYKLKADTINPKLRRLREGINTNKENIVLLKGEARAGREAKAKLEKLADSEPVSVEDKAAAELGVKVAEDRRDAWTDWRKASDAHHAISVRSSIAEALEKGKTSRELTKGLVRVAETIAKVGKAFGLHVKLDGGDLTIGKRPVKVCAENERWIARLACQAAVAELTDSPVVLTDAMETLWGERRDGLEALMGGWSASFPDIALVGFVADAGEGESLPADHVVRITAGETG